MGGTSRPQTISTKLQKIAEQAKKYPDTVFTTLMHHVTKEFLLEAYYSINRKGAAGLSGTTAEDYEKELGENIRRLHEELKSGRYKAPPLRRVWIEKDDNSKRPIAVPELEDKIAQRAVARLLENIYEEDFYDFSYGFRRGRSPHQALKELRDRCMEDYCIKWVVDADIRSYFDTIDHEMFKEILKKRVNDGSLIRLVGKWLKAGIMEDESLSYPELGAPQGCDFTDDFEYLSASCAGRLVCESSQTPVKGEKLSDTLC